MVSFPNSTRLDSDVKAFIDYYYEVLDSSRTQVIDEALKGVRTVQIVEFLNAAAAFASTLPEPDNSVGRPQLPSIPTSWTVEDVQLAVRYIYGVQASVSEADADKVIARLIEDYNLNNIPISWSLVQNVLEEMAAASEIIVVIEN